MATVFFSLNGKSAASRITFKTPLVNGVIFRKRPVIIHERPAKAWREPGERPEKQGQRQEGFEMMRFLKLLFVLAVLVGAAVLGYAYIGDLSPEQSDVSEPVQLNGE